MVAKRRGRPSLGVVEKFYFCITPEQREKMLNAAQEQGMSGAELIRRAIEAYLGRMEAERAH